MTLIALGVYLALIGFVLWLVNYYIPTVQPIKVVINVVVVIVVCLWLLKVFGITGPIIGP